MTSRQSISYVLASITLIAAATCAAGSTTSSPNLAGGIGSNLRRKCRGNGENRRCTITLKMEVENNGTARSGATVFRILLSDDWVYDEGDVLIREVAIPPLKPGRGKKWTIKKLKLPGSGDVEGKMLLGIIDPENKIVESDETDNELGLGPFPP